MQDKAPIQIDFYHLKSDDIATPLAMLCDKVVASGQKMLILAREVHFEAVSAALWSQKPESFLAHNKDDGEGADHAPVWVSTQPEQNQIQAEFIALTSGMIPPDLGHFKRVFNLFDGSDEQAVHVARQCWKEWSAREDLACCYFSQDEQGNWSQRQ